MNITSLVISSLLIGFVQCDLIGYNRLGNNVHSHRRFRTSVQHTNYKRQISTWFSENDVQVPAMNKFTKMQPKVTDRKMRNDRRRNLYNRRMIQKP